MKKLLENKVAIVTGAASGIGKSIAMTYAQNGAKIIVADINEEAGKEIVEVIKQHDADAIFIKTDASNPEDAQHLVNESIEQFGQINIAVNNAGIGGDSEPIADHPIESWNKTIDINLSGVFYGMKYQIPAMLKNGSGSIINMASILGQVGFATSAAYVAAKHGVIGLTKNAALEYAQEGIKTNAIGPGFINTPLLSESLEEEQFEQIKALYPEGRLGKPEEVAELALWLASDKSSFVNGAYYPIDGAYLAQ